MPNSFTPQQIEEFLQEFFDVVGARQYIGARYVPIFGRAGEDTVEWDDGAPYEPLTVVMHQGVSYVSRRYVPAGIQITDTDYWVETYRFNAQVEQYRQEVLGFQSQIDSVMETMESDYVPFPDATAYPKYGVLGQVLTTLTNGETKWEDPVTVDADVAEPLIEEWLDSHPEATTTVQDGAITLPKLNSDFAETIFRLLITNATVTDIPDANQIRRPGVYSIYQTDNIENLPTSSVGTLIVIGGLRNNQLYIDWNGNIWARGYHTSQTTWSEWVRQDTFESRAYLGSSVVPAIVFDTTNNTVTIKHPANIYLSKLFVSSGRIDTTADVVVSYASVTTAMVYILIDQAGNITAEPFNQSYDYADKTLLFYFQKNTLELNKNHNIPLPYAVGDVVYNQLLPPSFAFFGGSERVPAIMFNTTNSTFTIKAGSYVHVPKWFMASRRQAFDNDTTVSYANVGTNMVYVLMDRSGNVTCQRYADQIDFSTHVVLFYFQKTSLVRNINHNIPGPYSVDGAVFNNCLGDTVLDAVYVSTSGNDGNYGTKTSPFATFARALLTGAKNIFVFKGTYNEQITLTNVENLNIEMVYNTGVSAANEQFTLTQPMFMTGCANVHISDCVVDLTGLTSNYAYSMREGCKDIVFTNCVARNAPQGGFFSVNSDITYNGCLAEYIGNSTYTSADGFNMHGNGTTILNDCIAHDIYDDGVSNHDACVTYVNGGEFYNCTHGGGNCPTGHYTEINGAYIHDCLAGVWCAGVPTAIVNNTTITDSDTYDVQVDTGALTVVNSVFTTENVAQDATLTKVACRTA